MDEPFRWGFLGISTVAGLQGVDLKPLRTPFNSLPLLAEFVFANYALTAPRLQQHD